MAIYTRFKAHFKLNEKHDDESKINRELINESCIAKFIDWDFVNI